MELNDLERAYLSRPDVRAIVEHGRAHPEERVEWTRRTARDAGNTAKV